MRGWKGHRNVPSFGMETSSSSRVVLFTAAAFGFLGLSFTRALFRNFRARGPCLRQSNRDRLFAAFDLSPRSSTSQRPRFTLPHRAFDLGGRLF